MAFRLGFHKTLVKIGKWRFGIGYSSHGTTGALVLFLFFFLNLFWWMILASLWLLYGMCWLICLPFAKLIKKSQNKQKNHIQSNSINSYGE